MMLNRPRFLDEIEEICGIKTVWEICYRSWRAQQRVTAFPSGQTLMCTIDGPKQSGCEFDWL